MITMRSLWPPLKPTDDFSFIVNVIVQTARRDKGNAQGCAGIKREISILRDMKELLVDENAQMYPRRVGKINARARATLDLLT